MPSPSPALCAPCHAGISTGLCANADTDNGEVGGLVVEIQLRFEGLALHVQVEQGGWGWNRRLRSKAILQKLL